ncbi:hypothetical protein BN1184_AG_00020 [Pantoea ananatis]|nr:hypothetical protein BN1184_AG_00020 [Pantoea ananatis]
MAGLIVLRKWLHQMSPPKSGLGFHKKLIKTRSSGEHTFNNPA